MRKYLAVLSLFLALSPTVYGKKNSSDPWQNIRDALDEATTTNAPSTPRIDVGFSPEGSAKKLVLQIIRSAKSSLRLAAYSFTSPDIVRALLAAKKRGIDVAVLVDNRGNTSKSSQQALNLLVNAGIPTRTISAYAIHHDKYIVVDALHVETGSFNYSASASSRNSENVIVLWNAPNIASQYTEKWKQRWAQGQPYYSAY